MTQPNSAIATRGSEFISNTVAAAAFTGSNNTSIVEWNVGATAPFGGNSFVETRSATDGTDIAISSPGIYQVDFDLAFTGAVVVATGFSLGATGVITADPVVGVNGVVKVADDADSNANMTQVLSLSTAVAVRAAQVASGLANINFWATDGAAGAPVGVVAAGVQYRIQKLFQFVF